MIAQKYRDVRLNESLEKNGGNGWMVFEQHRWALTMSRHSRLNLIGMLVLPDNFDVRSRIAA